VFGINSNTRIRDITDSNRIAIGEGAMSPLRGYAEVVDLNSPIGGGTTVAPPLVQGQCDESIAACLTVEHGRGSHPDVEVRPG